VVSGWHQGRAGLEQRGREQRRAAAAGQEGAGRWGREEQLTSKSGSGQGCGIRVGRVGAARRGAAMGDGGQVVGQVGTGRRGCGLVGK
jgi:hypothetical protein